MQRIFRFFVLASFSLSSLHPEETHDDPSGYTINYNTVSILEYIRFASRISNTNFIYNKDDLDFSVSVISDAPITPENVMATLIQVLRIRGLSIIEQEGNLLIHRSGDVKQVATIVTGDEETKAPIVTRIFRIQNAKPDSIAAIIRPMISAESLLETSPETRQLIITDIKANVEKVASLIEILDSPHTPLDIQSYEVSNNKLEFLIDTANQIMAPITQGNPFILVPQPLAGTIFIVSTPELVERAMSILQTIDSPPREESMSTKKITPDNMLIFNAKHRSGAEILSALKSIATAITKTGTSEGDLVETINSGKFIPQTNALLFVGSIYSIAKAKEFLAALDIPSEFSADSFFIYKPVYRDAGELEKALREIGNNLKNSKDPSPSLVDTLDSTRVNPLTNTLFFSGDPATFPKIKEMLGKMDAETTAAEVTGGSNFFVYKIQNAPYPSIESALQFFASNLDLSNTSENGLINAIGDMKYIEETNSILFTGTDLSLKKLKELVPTFDKNISYPQVTNQLFIYKPKNQKEEGFYHSIREVTEDLKKNRFTDPSLLQALQSMKWMRGNGSFLFTGDAASIKRVEELAASLDLFQDRPPARPNYYIYKLQHTTAEILEEDFENLLKSFKASGVKDTKLIDVIENMRHVKETNSFLLTGDPAVLEEAKQLLQEYDYPRMAAKGAQSNFLMIKPQHVAASQLEKSLKEVAVNLKQADLADPNLLAAIGSVKYVEATNSLLFTGTPDALQKLQILIKDVDIPQGAAGIQHVGKTSFLLYKLKNGTGTQVVSSIRTLCADLKKSGASDKDFIEALQSAKYVRETNSILFTGNEKALKEVESCASQFDIASTCDLILESEECPTPATDFLSYKPVALSGPDLEIITNDFADNLKLSGLIDSDLFRALSSMRWVPQSQSLIFTGNSKALEQVKQLVTSFDIPSNMPAGAHEAIEHAIQGMDSTNFLVYKLQFHKGDEIQVALKQIAKDLAASGATVNVNLLNAINSTQWIQITNSLLCSGEQEILSRLRELIKSLDIPLKQVFIEMLVVETNLLNALEFGLEWGGKYKYRDKFQGSINNIVPPSNGGSCVIPDMLNNLNNYKPSSPMPSITEQIPFNCGFDLGIIGQVIKHNGETFLTLGSLLSALQNDNETSVILTPKIITQDGRTSTVFVGSNVPFIGSFVNQSGQSTVQTSNIEYRDVGLNLSVTPVLGNSDIVTLDITLDRSQTISDLRGNQINFNQGTATGIVTSKTNMQTTVHVPDKNFLILSGFVNNSSVKSTSGIPCLGGLPLIGAAFSKDNNTSNNQNIVIFLRPHVINSLEDLRRVTEDQEEAFRDQQGTPFLIHQFDDAMETIKSIDDR